MADKTRFKYKFVVMSIFGNVMATIYTDDVATVGILNCANVYNAKEVIQYEEIKEGLDWEETNRSEILYDPTRRRTL